MVLIDAFKTVVPFESNSIIVRVQPTNELQPYFLTVDRAEFGTNALRVTVLTQKHLNSLDELLLLPNDSLLVSFASGKTLLTLNAGCHQ